MIASLRGGLRLVVRVGGRTRLGLALFGSLISGLLELAGVGLILPLVIAITDPGAAGALPSPLQFLVPDSYARSSVVLLAVAVMAVFALRSLLTLALRWWLYGFVYAAEADLAGHLVNGYMRAPMSFHTARGSSDLIRVLQLSVDHVFQRIVLSSMTFATEGFVGALLVVGLMAFEPVIAVFTLLYFGAAALVFGRLTARRARAVGRRFQREHGEALQAAQEAFGGLAESVVRGTTSEFVSRFSNARRRASMSKQRFQFLSELPRIYLESTFLVGVCLMIVVVLMTNETSAGATASLVLAAAVGFRALPSIVKVTGAVTTLRTGSGALELVERDLDELAIDITQPLVLAPQVSRSDGRPRAIEIAGVSYAYTEEGEDSLAPVILDDISLKAAAGSWIGIVGDSGAGKTTLLLVLLGLLDPPTGSVCVDGKDIRDDLPQWRSQIGYVPQDVFLMNSSVADNVRYGLHHPDDDVVLSRSLEDAALGEFVRALPEGVNTNIAERGARLSGGQRQRLGIARALYGRPGVLVLDEATSSLDGETERAVIETIRTLKGKLTVVSVAHRLSTVRSCDLLYVLREGRVVASGTFDELVATNKYFRDMASMSQT